MHSLTVLHFIFKNDFENLIQSNKYIEIRRGLRDSQNLSKPVKNQIEEFKNGDLFNGKGVYGDGTYWGGASEKQQLIAQGVATRHSEGKEFKIEDPILSLEKLTSDLWGGISSAVSYSGFNSLENFIYK